LVFSFGDKLEFCGRTVACLASLRPDRSRGHPPITSSWRCADHGCHSPRYQSPAHTTNLIIAIRMGGYVNLAGGSRYSTRVGGRLIPRSTRERESRQEHRRHTPKGSSSARSNHRGHVRRTARSSCCSPGVLGDAATGNRRANARVRRCDGWIACSHRSTWVRARSTARCLIH